MAGTDDRLDVDADLADTTADVEAIDTDVVTESDVVADMADIAAADGSTEIAAPH
jgi:hypothetical protein